LPEGMSRRDQGEIMKPVAAGSVGGKEQFNTCRYDQEQKKKKTSQQTQFATLFLNKLSAKAQRNHLILSSQSQPGCNNCGYIQRQWRVLAKTLALMAIRDD